MGIRCWTGTTWTAPTSRPRAKLRRRAGRHVLAQSSRHADRIPGGSSRSAPGFRQAVARFANNDEIPVIKFKKSIQKATVIKPLLRWAV